MIASEPDQPDSNNAADEEIAGKGDSGQQLAGHYMGFGARLRRWRKSARVNQLRAAKALGMSERTYRKIEQGATSRLTRAQCDSFATLVGLDRDERHALLLYNIGSSLAQSSDAGQPSVPPSVRLLLDRQMPSPAYLCDKHWNILAFNAAMAEWWTWVMRPGANLIRWALTDPEARFHYQDWDKHASAYVKMLKFAEASRERENDEQLHRLIADVKKDPDVRHIWETENDMGETRDGHVFRMNVPALGWETVEVVSHVQYPASLPECRFVVITWVEGDEDDERDALGGIRNAWAATTASQEDVESAQRHAQNRAAEDAATRWRQEAARLGARTVVATAEEAQAQAGPNGIPLPVISDILGPGARLTISTVMRTVVWAVKEAAGTWSVTHVSPATVIARTAQSVGATEDGACLEEVRQLVRAALPTDPSAAAARIGQILDERETEIGVLRDVLHSILGSTPEETENPEMRHQS
ncbi:helix-turn-helix transcriptional regulator [Streptomyces sp. NPDC087294]|uniref:helix-turn-helix transcriptional regulator n=1 Tax=Streptomyces sp. NPDC087294 TaxID=3365777 RepID=UPI003820634D